MHRSFRWLALLSVALIATIGFFGISSAQNSTDRSQLRFVVVSHGQASDPFWSVVQNGVDQAGKDMGVKVEYQAPTDVRHGGDVAADRRRRRLHPDGLVVSIPDADALGRFDQGRRRRRHPGHLDRTRAAMSRGARRAHPRRADRVRGGPRWRAAHGRGRRHERPLRQSGSRQRRARRPLSGLHGRAWPSPAARSRCSGRSEQPDRGPSSGSSAALTSDPGYRRHPDPRSDRRRAGAGGARRNRPAWEDQARHVRPLAGCPGGDRGRQHALRDRSSSSTCRGTCRSCC